MKEKMFRSLILTCILVLVTSCKEQKSQTAGSDYKTQKVTLSDRTLYSTFSATIQGKQDVGVYPQISGLITARSEERRVGKECRSRWSPYH